MLSPFLLDAFAPPLEVADGRGERTARAIEEAWGIHLICDFNEQWQQVRIPQDRATYLVPDERGHLPFLTTPEDEPQASFSAMLEPDVFAPEGVPELHLLAHVPVTPAQSAQEGLDLVARAIGASWAMITPEGAHAVIVQQVIAPGGDEVPPAGLPRLDLAEVLPRNVPRRLGWINYWSAPVATRIGFDGTLGDGVARARRMASGWIAQLTDEPLDLDRPDHLDALKRAYARFPSIGRRA